MCAAGPSADVPLEAELIALPLVPHVIAEGVTPTLAAARPVAEAATLLATSDAEAVAVKGADGRYLGLVSLRDVARAVAEGRLQAPVADRMQPRRDWLAPDDTPLDALELFRCRGVDQLPVLAREPCAGEPCQAERLIGILSLGQLVSLLHRHFEQLSMQRQRRIFGLDADE